MYCNLLGSTTHYLRSIQTNEAKYNSTNKGMEEIIPLDNER